MVAVGCIIELFSGYPMYSNMNIYQGLRLSIERYWKDM